MQSIIASGKEPNWTPWVVLFFNYDNIFPTKIRIN